MKQLKKQINISVISKDCSVCKQEKPIDEFSLSRSRNDGHCDRCKACDKIYNAARSKKNMFNDVEKMFIG